MVGGSWARRPGASGGAALTGWASDVSQPGKSKKKGRGKGEKEREKLAPCYHKYIEEVRRVKNTNPTRSVRVHNMIWFHTAELGKCQSFDILMFRFV